MTQPFEKLFGLPPEQINKNCIILPLNDAPLFTGERGDRGVFFRVYNQENYTVITLKNRWLAGDLALMLGETPCENLILFGSCGGIDEEPGALFLAEKVLNLESFSGFLNHIDGGWSYPSEELFEIFKNHKSFDKFNVSLGATVSSLWLEEERLDYFREKGISFLEMEASMVFAGAAHAGIRALGVFYLSDVPGKLNYYDEFNPAAAEKIKGARRSAALIIQNIISDELS